MKRYRYSEEARAVLEGMQLPLAVYQNLNGQVVTLLVSDGFCRLLGYAEREKAVFDMDHDMYKDTHPDDRDRIISAALQFMNSSEGEYDAVFRTKAGVETDYHVIHAHGKHFTAEDGTRLAQVWYMDEGMYIEGEESAATGMHRELNSALHEESILRAANYDALTGLPNLAYFFKLCEILKERLLREGKQGVLLYMDLNGMKYFNDRNGFAEGDELLKIFADLLVRTFGTDRCCHIGADRFAAASTDDRLEERLNRFFGEVRQLKYHLPVRVGIYSTAVDAAPVSTAYDRAKIACDTIRKSETSEFRYYTGDLGEKDKRRRYIESSIDKAIANHWIRVYCQPIIRAVNEKVCNEEALARWIDPEMGFLSPAEFIPELEASGQIYKLDLYVLDEVLKKINLQKINGMSIVPHSINLSRSDFEACDIVEEIRKRVDNAEIERKLISIEITESVLGSDFDYMKEQVDRFRKMGFPVWLDDFGSGYSSLDVLQSIPFDLIKLDMSFIRKLNEGETARIVLTELVKLVTSLGIDTVCEGVETKEQVHFLQEIGCSKLQGFYYHKPMPYEELLERYEKGLDVGFEDPRQSFYYETMGRINMYNMDVIASQDTDAFQNAFNTMPIGIIEIIGKKTRYVRSNPSYRTFINRFFGEDITTLSNEYKPYDDPFLDMVAKKCTEPGSKLFFEGKLPDGSAVHSFARRIGKNPVTGVIAIAIAVLSVTDPEETDRIENVRKERDALARVMAITEDYMSLYSVDPETGHYIEYTASPEYKTLGFEKAGEDFFRQGVTDGKKTVYAEDLPGYLRDFTKENILKMIEAEGRYTIHYRLVIQGEPVRVSLKIAAFHDGIKTRLLAGVRKWRDRK